MKANENSPSYYHKVITDRQHTVCTRVHVPTDNDAICLMSLSISWLKEL